MHLDEICRRLDREFGVDTFQDEWPQLAHAGVDIQPYASPQFLGHGNGLLFRGWDDVEEIYTAVYPSPTVIDYISRRSLTGTLLICHYPMHLDGRRGYLALTEPMMADLRDQGASLYVLHSPLAHGRTLATWRSLARTLGVRIAGTFEQAGLVGCYGSVDVEDEVADVFSFSSMVLRVEERLGISNSQVVENIERAVGRVAIVPGDGADPAMLATADELGCHTYITGILNNPVADPAAYERSQVFLAHADVRALNLIGASQYATLAPAMRVLATWLKVLDLPVEFAPDQPELPEFMAG